MTSDFDPQSIGRSLAKSRSALVYLWDATPGDVPVPMTIGELEGVLQVVERWRNGAQSILAPHLLTCLQSGLIGLSRPMRALAGGLCAWAGSPDHLLVMGEQGTSFRGVARCLVRLRTERRVEGTFQPWSQAKYGVYLSDMTLFVFDIESLDRQDQGAILEAVDRGMRVIGFTHEPLDAIDKVLLPTLAGHFAAAGVVEVPPLCMRPEDLPLLFYYILRQYSQSNYGVPGITVASLYKAAGERWPGNEVQLRSQLKSACEQTWEWYAHMWFPEEADGPFVPGEIAFQATVDMPGMLAETDIGDIPVVSMNELPSYDLKALMEAVDAVAEPAQRGRWTLDARARQFEEESCDQPTAKDPPVETQGSHDPQASAGPKKPEPPLVESWSEVTITLTSEDTVKITRSADHRVIAQGSYGALGFEMGNSPGNPVISWSLLKILIREQEIPSSDRQKVYDLRKRLIGLVGLKGDPIPRRSKGGGWRPAFVPQDRSYGGAGGPAVPRQVSLSEDDRAEFDMDLIDPDPEEEKDREIREAYEEDKGRKYGHQDVP